MLRAWILFLALTLTSVGCGANPIRETTPLSAKPSSFASSVVTVSPGSIGGTMNLAKYMNTFREGLAKKLMIDKTIASVATTGDKGDLAIRATFVKVDAGSAAARDTGLGGEAEVSVDVELFDQRSSKLVGRFVVTASSSDYEKSWGDVLLGTPLDDYGDRAALVAAEHTAKYLSGER